jgi:hypothetical protein
MHILYPGGIFHCPNKNMHFSSYGKKAKNQGKKPLARSCPAIMYLRPPTTTTHTVGAIHHGRLRSHCVHTHSSPLHYFLLPPISFPCMSVKPYTSDQWKIRSMLSMDSIAPAPTNDTRGHISSAGNHKGIVWRTTIENQVRMQVGAGYPRCPLSKPT